MAKATKAFTEIIKRLLGVRKLEVEFTGDEERLILLLDGNRGTSNIKDLSSAMDKSTAGIVDLVEGLSKKGVGIWYDEKSEQLTLENSRTERSSEETLLIKDKETKIGILSDSLLGSKYQQLTALHLAHQIAEQQGVDFMIHLGVSAGCPAPAQWDEFFLHTAKEQADYIAANYPHSEKYKTRFISGYHDMKWRAKGSNVLRDACRKRTDLLYRDDLVSDFTLRRGTEKGSKWPILRAAYRGGDNSPYSKSYPIQGFAETLIQDVGDLFSDNKPDIGVVAGQGVYMDLASETVDCLISVPGMRTVSPSILRKKYRMMSPTIGLVILTIRFKEDGRFFVKKREFFPIKSIKSDYKVKITDDKKAVAELSVEERKVLELLEKSPRSCGEISQAIDKSNETVVEIIKSLRSYGYDIKKREESGNYKLTSDTRQNWDVKPINFEDYFKEKIEEGAVSDTHYGSVADLIPIQSEAYDIFEARGIKDVNHIGDLSNGPSKHNEHQKREVYEDRATPLIDLIARRYPMRDGITTHIIGGNHDGWFGDVCGLEFVRHVADLRSDFDYLGPCEGERQVGRAMICLKHYDWGTGYAKSYKPQAVVETILKEISKETARYKGKSIIVLSGGGHVYCSMIIKGIIFILMPCLQGKTGFVNRMGKISDVGFLIFSVTHSKTGELTCFSVEYFDRIAKAREIERKKVTNEKRRNALVKEKRTPKTKKTKEVKEKEGKKEKETK